MIFFVILLDRWGHLRQIFGTFILLAIFYSSLFSFGLLMALLATVGPVSPRNDFFELYSWGRRLLGQRRIGG